MNTIYLQSLIDATDFEMASALLANYEGQRVIYTEGGPWGGPIIGRLSVAYHDDSESAYCARVGFTLNVMGDENNFVATGWWSDYDESDRQHNLNVTNPRIIIGTEEELDEYIYVQRANEFSRQLALDSA